MTSENINEDTEEMSVTKYSPPEAPEKEKKKEMEQIMTKQTQCVKPPTRKQRTATEEPTVSRKNTGGGVECSGMGIGESLQPILSARNLYVGFNDTKLQFKLHV